MIEISRLLVRDIFSSEEKVLSIRWWKLASENKNTFTDRYILNIFRHKIASKYVNGVFLEMYLSKAADILWTEYDCTHYKRWIFEIRYVPSNVQNQS